jgi:hypothetical protein
VLLDGPAWARRRTVGDRDGLPVEVLGGMLRWPAVERVWLPEWLADPEAVLDRLVAAAQAPTPGAAPAPATPPPAPAAAARPPSAPDPGFSPIKPAEEPTVEEVAAAPAPARALDGEEPFLPWTPKPAGDKVMLDRLANPRGADKVRKVMLAGVAAEGPIHVDRLARLTAGAFGLSRVLRARLDALGALVPESARAGDFVWPDGMDRTSWTGFRRDAEAARPMEQVSPEELGNAMVALCRASAGMTKDELFTQTLEVFGYRRRSAAQLAVLEVALAATTAAGRLTASPSGLLTA